MTKPEFGTKRLCAHCGVKFFDLNRSPPTCPKCETAFQPTAVSPRGRPEAARAPFRKSGPVTTKTPQANFVSPEDADAETQGEQESLGDAPEEKEGVELGNERIDDAAFIEETEDTDVAEIIGGDLESDKEI
jgi:uncharacterized protein (TIGR02300 family)